MRSALPGCMMPAAAASIASPDGRRCAKASTTAVTALMAASPNMRSGRRIMSRGCPIALISPRSPRSYARASRRTRGSRKPKRGQASGSRFRASAACHVAIQYAKAMGLHVVALDVTEEKLALARSLGAELAINAGAPDAISQVLKQTGGAHGVLVTAVSPPAFSQALQFVRRKGTVSLVGLPPGDFATPI